MSTARIPARRPTTAASATSAPATVTPAPNPAAGAPGTGVANTGSTGATATVNRAWEAMNNAGTRLNAEARVQGFWTDTKDARGQVYFVWDKPGDALPLKMSVHIKGNPSLDAVKPYVHTNANNAANPDVWTDVLMDSAVEVKGKDGRGQPVDVRAEGPDKVATLLKQLDPAGEYDVTYIKDLPVTQPGNYSATGFTKNASGVVSWAGDTKIPDIRFRPRATELNQLSLYEVSVPNVNGKGFGTLEDMLEPGSPFTNGKCTLEYIAKELGCGGVWMQPVFPRTEHGRHPVDDLGSPYGIRDFHSIDPLLSRRAQELKNAGAPEEEVRQAANQAWDKFSARCKELGLEICMDVPFNHLGHNYEFKDVFSRIDAAGKEFLEVHANDFSQVAINPQQADVINQRLADPNVPDYLEYVLPEFYASRFGDANGARNVSETTFGGSPGEPWKDVKQLNNGGEHAPGWNDQKKAVLAWQGRTLKDLILNKGVSMVRLDHDNGNRENNLEFTNMVLNQGHAALGEKPMGVIFEDFHSADGKTWSRDALQVTWLRSKLASSNSAATYRDLISNPYFTHANLANITSHDEHRFDFQGNAHTAGRTFATNLLVFNMNMMVAGDEMMEQQQLPFKQHKDVPSLVSQQAPEVNKITVEMIRRANVAKQTLAAFRNPDTTLLRPAASEAPQKDLLACVRNPLDASQPSVFVFSNTTMETQKGGRFALDGVLRERVEAAVKQNPNARFQVFNAMADDANKPVWAAPRSGQDLLNNGIGAILQGNEVQALVLKQV